MKKFKLSLLLLLCVVLNSNAQWTSAGFNNLPNHSDPVSSSGYNQNRMAIHPETGKVYLAVTRASNGHKIDLMRLDGSTWVYDTQNITSGSASKVNLKIANDGAMYLAFSDHSNSGQVSVLEKAAGSSTWSMRGNAFSTGNIRTLDLAIRSGILYSNGLWGHNTVVIAYENGGPTFVMQNGYYASWTQLGSLYSGSSFARPSVIINGNMVSVARCISNSGGQRIYVDQYDLSTTWMGWQAVGSGPITSDGFNFAPTIALNPATNNLSVFYGEFTSTSNSNYSLKMANFDGTNWNQLGSDVLSSSSAPVVIGQSYDLDFHPITGEPYVLFREGSSQSGGMSLSVKKYSGSTWSNVGSSVFMNHAHGDLQFHPQTNAPYVVGHWLGSPNVSVEYFDDGCSRVLGSTSEQITSGTSGAVSYEFEVINWDASFAQLVSSSNNYILITDIPGWVGNTTYAIRSRARYYSPFFGYYWTGWTDVCYITSPASGGEFEGRRKMNPTNEVANSEVSLYPNPSTGTTNLSLGMELKGETFTLYVYNTSGQLVRSLDQSMFNASGKTELDLNNLPKGIYSLVGQVGTISVNEKLILN